MSEKTDKTEKLILEIQKKPILYDKGRQDFKDVTKKRDVWKQIAIRVGFRDVETRWKNVKDGLAKSRRNSKTKSGDGARKVKEYKYEKLLGFLSPFQTDRPTTSNLVDSDAGSQAPEEDINDDIKDVDYNSEPDSPAPPQPRDAQSDTITPSTSISVQPHTRKNDRKRCHDEVDKSLCEYLKMKTSTPVKKTTTPVKMQQQPRDDLDFVMQSMAATMRKLPGRQCAKVKFEIHNIVHNAEMEYLYPSAEPQQRGPITVQHGSSYQLRPISANSCDSIASMHNENVNNSYPGCESNRLMPSYSGMDCVNNYNHM